MSSESRLVGSRGTTHSKATDGTPLLYFPLRTSADTPFFGQDNHLAASAVIPTPVPSGARESRENEQYYQFKVNFEPLK